MKFSVHILGKSVMESLICKIALVLVSVWRKKEDMPVMGKVYLNKN